MSRAVRFEHDATIGTITLDRPDNRNSMTAELLDAFSAALAEARAVSSLRCLVITGTGACFSAGADFKAILQREPAPGARPLAPHERSLAMYQPFLAVLDVDIPVIGALNGHAVGGGFGLALCCDLRLAAREGRYGANFARLGLHPGMAITHLLPRLVGAARAAELLFTGRLVDGDEAARLGLVNDVVPAAEVPARARALAETIAANAPGPLRTIKRALFASLATAAREAALAESFAQSESLATADAAEGIAALLARRAPSFTGR